MKKLIFTVMTLVTTLLIPNTTYAQERYLGEMIYFAGNFAPRNFAFCDGQLLAISQYTALFSVLGTTYGGDGRTSFALPDMRGRALMHPGAGPGLTPRVHGEKSGKESTTLNAATMPVHTHQVNVANADADTNNPTGVALAQTKMFKAGQAANVQMNSTGIADTGTDSPQAINNIQPVLAVNCIIALQGVFPSRS